MQNNLSEFKYLKDEGFSDFNDKYWVFYRCLNKFFI